MKPHGIDKNADICNPDDQQELKRSDGHEVAEVLCRTYAGDELKISRDTAALESLAALQQ